MTLLSLKASLRGKMKCMNKARIAAWGRRAGGLVVGREKPIKRLIASQALCLLKILTLKAIRAELAGRSRLSLDFLSHGKT
jgi:hypothetical protein